MIFIQNYQILWEFSSLKKKIDTDNIHVCTISVIRDVKL
jgi:hypothetical protein